MNTVDTPNAASPFDAIRRIEEDGSERWYGRDLMPVMDYSRWDKFAVVINKAKSSLALVQGEDAAAHHFPTWGSDGGRWGVGRVADFRLTRFGAYLTAMAGDDTKRAVAEARIYFAVRTREAEVAATVGQAPTVALPQSFAEALQLAANQARQMEEQQAQLAIAAPKVAYVDQFVDPAKDSSIVNAVAGQFSLTERQLRDYLLERGVLYRRTVADYINSKGKRRVEYEWLARAGFRTWFVAKDHPEVDRLYNGQLRTTLYVTPVGKQGIADLLAKHPIDGGAA